MQPDLSGAVHVRTDVLLLCAPIALSTSAPRLARDAVVDALAGRMSATMADRARLVVSELVTNSLVHGAAGQGEEVLVTLHATENGCQIEVKDPGRTGAIAPRAPDRVNGGGMGLLVVDAVCARWGVLRDEDGSSRVWAELSDGDVAPG
jgi:two-component sensor histidine kinase